MSIRLKNYRHYKAWGLTPRSYAQHMFCENTQITYTVGVRFQILKLWKSKARCEKQRWKENKVSSVLSPLLLSTVPFPRNLSRVQLANLTSSWAVQPMAGSHAINRQISRCEVQTQLVSGSVTLDKSPRPHCLHLLSRAKPSHQFVRRMNTLFNTSFRMVGSKNYNGC